MKYTLRQLEIFIAVARHESVSRAADALALSQSATSTALGELERQFDTQLFDRIGKALRLNEAGHVLLPQALKRMTPPIINLYTRIIKTSSLAVLIGVVEVIKAGQQIIERTYESVLIYGALFLFFFLVCYPLSAASRVLERRWAHA